MASRLFPDNGSRYVFKPNGDQASNGLIVYYLDAAGQNRAPVYTYTGADAPTSGDALENSQTRLDAFGGQLLFWGPDDGADVLYATVDGGPIFRVAAIPEPRLRALETAIGEAASTDALDALAETVDAKADDTAVVHTSGAETVGGVKTFSSPPVVPTPTAGGHAATKDYADIAARNAAFGPLKRALDDGTTSVSVQILGDSTGNDSSEWVGLLSQQMAADYPGWSVHRRTWSDTAQAYGAPVVMSGSATGRYLDCSTGIRSRMLPVSAAPNLTGTIDVRVRATLSDWDSGVQVNLAGRSGNAGARGWYLMINTAGRIGFVFSTDGTALTSVLSTASTGFAPGATGWVRAVFVPDDGAGNRTTSFYTSSDGLTWTQIGTTTTTAGTVTLYDPNRGYEVGGVAANIAGRAPHIHEVWISAGGSSPSIVPALPELWPRIDATSAPIVGPPVLTFVNGSMPGAGISYLGDATRLPLMVPLYGQVLTFLSDSHNEGASTNHQWIATYDSWLNAVQARLPGAPIVVVVQNPATTAATWYPEHAQRCANLIAYARARRLPAIDVFGAFMAVSGWETSHMLDPVHPNSTGSVLWMNTVKAAFDAAPTY